MSGVTQTLFSHRRESRFLLTTANGIAVRVRPKSNMEFWDSKFEKNRSRDTQVNKLLRGQGWRVLRFWEHEVEENSKAVAHRILVAIRSTLPKQNSRWTSGTT
jgi:G:T-mismatch repair DNA endonuclease (very short patch repair protein)